MTNIAVFYVVPPHMKLICFESVENGNENEILNVYLQLITIDSNMLHTVLMSSIIYYDSLIVCRSY